MSNPTIPVHFDWQFWSALLALMAIVLSQLPPVHLWFRPRRLEVEVHSKVNITHKVGNPTVNLFVSVRNTGGRELRIKAARATISRDGKQIADLPCQNYFEAPSSASHVLFVPFSLKPGETWAHGANFLQFFDRQTEKRYRACESAMAADIRAKLTARPNGDKNLVTAEPNLVAPFVELFERMFIWLPGEYVLTLSVVADVETASFDKRYRFTLFESDAGDLRAHVDDYRYGAGIYFDSERHVASSIPLMAPDV